MRYVDMSNAPKGEIICHSPDGALYRLIEPDYWQLVTPAPIPTPGSEAAFGEFKQACQCSIKTGGITIRDYFAAKCDVAVYTPFDNLKASLCRHPTVGELAEYIAGIRFIEADAMLSARGESK